MSDSTALGVTPPLQIRSITCSAQGATCPAIHGSSIDLGTLAAGGVFTFTVTTTVAADYGGRVAETFYFYSTDRAGSAKASAHATLQDSRDAQYEIFSTSGRRTAALVTFADGAARFQDLAGNAPVPFTSDQGGYLFADGSHFVTPPDMIIGRHDFGAGPETFIGGRAIDASPADIDGTGFTLFTADATAGGTPTTAVHAAAISGSTLTICMDAAPQASDTCPPASQWRYTFSLDGTLYTATDNQHGDTMHFQVLFARNSRDRYLVRAEKVGSASHFAIGLPGTAPPAPAQDFIGDAGGHWSRVQLSPSSYASAAFMSQGGFGPLGASAAMQPVANGPAGLQQLVRANDGVTVLLADSAAMAVQIGAPGELDLLALSKP
ncbi:MAG: hypothetical protein JF586_04195 [Burkholderiales bacterium]|nr:hypothetical protein [Burkholderiales bacterium]